MKRQYAPVNCAEAAEISTKAEYREAGFLDRLRLRLHLFFCKNCRKYERDNQKLSELLKKAKIQECSEDEKNRYKKDMMDNNLDLFQHKKNQ